MAEPKSTPAQAPSIAVVRDIDKGHPHAQLLMDVPGMFFNVVADDDDQVAELARRLDRFLEGGEGEFFTFVSTGDGREHYLTRAGARHVLAVTHARSQGAIAARPRDPRTRLVDLDGKPLYR